MQVDETTVDVDDVIARMQAVRRGELPQDAVSVEELRAAIAAQRARYKTTAEGTGTSAPKSAAKKKSTLVVPKLDLGL